MGIRKRLTRRALELSQKAVERLMADEQRAMKIAEAIGTVQRGKQAMDRSQEEFLRALNFASKGDMKALGKRFSSLKRRLRELDERLDSLRR
jgi:polyhydroxyalkanoate synthesis regulator phasin